MKDLMFQKGDAFDPLVTTQNRLFGYSDVTVEWPNMDFVNANDGIDPEVFYNIIQGVDDHSEFNAIYFYRNIAEIYDEVATAFSGVSFVEMQHWDKLKDLTNKLGGNIYSYAYNNAELISITERSVDAKEAIREAIKSEQRTIDEYMSIQDYLNSLPESISRTLSLALIKKLIADETYHVEQIFKPLLINLYNN